jgi:hypothetical protein
VNLLPRFRPFPCERHGAIALRLIVGFGFMQHGWWRGQSGYLKLTPGAAPLFFWVAGEHWMQIASIKSFASLFDSSV